MPSVSAIRVKFFHVIQTEARKASILIATAAVYTDCIIALPNAPRHFVVKVAGRRVAEDQYITFGNRLCFIPSIPYGKFTAVLVVTNVPGGFHVVFLGRGMDKLVLDSVDLDFNVCRQLADEIENLGSDIFAIMFELLMRNHTAVPVPKPFFSPIRVFLFFGCIFTVTDGVEHHIFMIANQHFGIGHSHDLS